MGIKEDQTAGKLKGQNRTTQRSAASLRRGRGGWASFGKETVFYIFVTLVFSGCSSQVGRAPGALPWATPFM